MLNPGWRTVPPSQRCPGLCFFVGSKSEIFHSSSTCELFCVFLCFVSLALLGLFSPEFNLLHFLILGGEMGSQRPWCCLGFSKSPPRSLLCTLLPYQSCVEPSCQLLKNRFVYIYSLSECVVSAINIKSWSYNFWVRNNFPEKSTCIFCC